ncbi:MAG TPA: UDP-N-acetylmuramate--L-alanine ligase [Elusimicrobia bacterium]|nr:UDP-N-acetylmuramate--L-alanine ligase [Elusimicrobiota bacterium]HBT61981.1 UDP-N-acetylmuramate--L-alanine ligase [Elusimicrobiota bacterium]
MRSFVKRVHFVGIGGVGMSGIAELLCNLGYQVSGSDMSGSEITCRLKAAGARVFLGHRAAQARGAQVVVVSSAVPARNCEVAAARRAGVPVVLRAQMLAELGRMKKTVTVAGSHGKTTTTAMVAMALSGAGAQPTMIVGGQIKNIAANARLGLGDYMVAEADESDGSFVHLAPLVAVVTNIDNDHLDFHKNMDNLREAFRQHLARLPFYGAAVLCADDPALAGMARELRVPVIGYGLRRRADWQARGVRMGRDGSLYEAWHKGRRLAEVRLRVPGRHNVLNSLAALAVGRFLGFPLAGLVRGLAAFRGVGRRLDRLGAASGIEFVDDYGHHPTEVRAAVDAVAALWRAGRGRRQIVIFQPHRYTRTRLLARDFGKAFKRADFVYVMDIYPAGEAPIQGVSSRLILDSLRREGVACAAFAGSLEALRRLRRGDVVLTLGAGDVWKTGVDLLRRLQSELASPV